VVVVKDTNCGIEEYRDRRARTEVVKMENKTHISENKTETQNNKRRNTKLREH